MPDDGRKRLVDLSDSVSPAIGPKPAIDPVQPQSRTAISSMPTTSVSPGSTPLTYMGPLTGLPRTYWRAPTGGLVMSARALLAEQVPPVVVRLDHERLVEPTRRPGSISPLYSTSTPFSRSRSGSFAPLCSSSAPRPGLGLGRHLRVGGAGVGRTGVGAGRRLVADVELVGVLGRDQRASMKMSSSALAGSPPEQDLRWRPRARCW